MFEGRRTRFAIVVKSAYSELQETLSAKFMSSTADLDMLDSNAKLLLHEELMTKVLNAKINDLVKLFNWDNGRNE